MAMTLARAAPERTASLPAPAVVTVEAEAELVGATADPDPDADAGADIDAPIVPTGPAVVVAMVNEAGVVWAADLVALV